MSYVLYLIILQSYKLLSRAWSCDVGLLILLHWLASPPRPKVDWNSLKIRHSHIDDPGHEYKNPVEILVPILMYSCRLACNSYHQSRCVSRHINLLVLEINKQQHFICSSFQCGKSPPNVALDVRHHSYVRPNESLMVLMAQF